MPKQYPIPFPFEQAMKRRIKKVDTAAAVHDHLNTIIQTPLLRCQFAPLLGSALASVQHSNPQNAKEEQGWEDRIRKKLKESIIRSIEHYEPRLKMVKVKVALYKPTANEASKDKVERLKKKDIVITISGRLQNGDTFPTYVKSLPLI